MSHPIIDGRVEVLKIVTPGAYWIRCAGCKGTSRVPCSIRRKPHPNEFYYPSRGAEVFARDEDGFFYRGIVCGRRNAPVPSFWKYVVQLIDTFQVKDIELDEVYPTYNESNKSCESAHLVSIDHLLPEIPPISYGKSIKFGNKRQFLDFENRVTSWDESLPRLAELYKSEEFFFIQSKVINGCVYGDLSFSLPGGVSNVVEYLWHQRVGIRIMYRFEEVVSALMVNDLIDYSTLMPTFDPLDIRQSARPPTPQAETVDSPGFRVYEEDVLLHRALWTPTSCNIIFEHEPMDHEVVIRYVNPLGEIVLGTVVNINVKTSMVTDLTLIKYSPRQWFRCLSFADDLEPNYPESLFNRLPPDVEDVEPPLFSFDLETAYRDFRTRGGLFIEGDSPITPLPRADELIEQYFKFLQVSDLYDWQKLCFSTLRRQGNLCVMGLHPTAKLTTLTAFALSRMSLEDHSFAIGPILIVFVADFSRADKVARLCKQLTDFKVIVSNSLFISEKQKKLALDGCDVLITSPCNWTKLVFLGIFDYRRLNCVIFDQFSKLSELYDTDVAQVFVSVKFSDVQITIISNCWGQAMSKHLMRLKSVTVCILDALLRNLFLRVIPNVVFFGCNDWSTVLEKVVNEKTACRRLLLCKNQEEGQAISEAIHSEAMFVHENQPVETSSRIVDKWRVDPKLLICTDDCFKQIGVKDVDVLISWKSRSLTNLSSRLLALSSFPKIRRKVALVYILCDYEDLDELLVVKGISEHVRFINGSLDDHLTATAKIVECGKVGPVCKSVFMLGKCADDPVCTQRHLFNKNDNLESFSSSHFLKVDIIRVHSAFRYSVRVYEIISNSSRTPETLSSLTSTLEKIEAALIKCKNHQPPRLEVGKMVGAEIPLKQERVLRRAIVTSLPGEGSSLYTLALVDFDEPDVLVPLTDLFALSDDITDLPADIVELFITAMTPIDFKSEWQFDTCAYVMNARSEFFRDCPFLAGRVELISARTVLVDSLHCFEHQRGQYVMKSLDPERYSSLKDLILHSNYCEENSDHLSRLSTLLEGIGLPPLVNRDLRLARLIGPDMPESRVLGVVSHYHDPGQFCVQLQEEYGGLARLDESCDPGCSEQALILVGLRELCAVRNDDEWNRAIVEDIFFDGDESSVRVLFVDYGDAKHVRPADLYSLPSELEEVPFFAIQSELVGIQPLNGLWEDVATSYFKSSVWLPDDVVKDLLVSFHGVNSSGRRWRHRVVLADPDSPEGASINFDMARTGMAAFDPDTKHLIIVEKKKIRRNIRGRKSSERES